MDGGAADTGVRDTGGGAAFAVTTPWAEGGMIAPMYTCGMMNHFPTITWTDGPAGTMSYAFTFFDMANSLVHIAMVDIPGNVRKLPPVPMGVRTMSIGTVNDTTWAGPCPSAGTSHVYQVTIYALRTATFNGGNSATVIRAALEDAGNADVLARAKVNGRGMR